jgi:hypothetical protein
MTAKRRKTVPPSAGGKRPSKSPAIAPSYESPLKLRPAWSIELLEKNGPYGWETIKGVLLWNTILPTLRNFETMTWGEILGSQNHEVQVSSLCSEAQKRLKMLKLDDTSASSRCASAEKCVSGVSKSIECCESSGGIQNTKFAHRLKSIPDEFVKNRHPLEEREPGFLQLAVCCSYRLGAMPRISLFRRGHAGGKGRAGGVASVMRLPSGSPSCASVE